jgi:single-stranded-DNA-specific exonuclease
MKDNWILRSGDEVLISRLSESLMLDPSLVSVLCRRGYRTREDISTYLNPHLSQMHNPFMLSGMHEAVKKIRGALDGGMRIGIFADSDLDGLTSLAVMRHVLGRLSADIVHRFPRNAEAYGLTLDVINEFHEAGVGLIITVDSGIRDHNEIAHAGSLGMEVIVTDHHEPDEKYPLATIINPRLPSCPYPNKNLAGVGVAFKLSLALMLSYLPTYNRNFILLLNEDGILSAAEIINGILKSITPSLDKSALDELLGNQQEPPCVIYDGFGDTPSLEGEKINSLHCITELVPPHLKSLRKYNDCLDIAGALSINFREDERRLDILVKVFFELQRISSPKIADFLSYALGMVSIGSIADVMPLTGENRVLTAFGLRALEQTSHCGLARVLGKGRIDAKKIGWDLAPLLNSPGRFGRAELTASFFIDLDPLTNASVLEEIKKINSERKKLVQSSLAETMNCSGGEIISDQGGFVVARYRDIPDGMAGLIANRLLDRVQKPVIVLIYPARDGIIKGSGRAPASVDFFSATASAASFFDRIGGHAQAFGFSIREEVADAMLEKLSVEIQSMEAKEPQLDVDMEIALENISSGLLKLFRRMEPFGKGNEEPVFLLKKAIADEFIRFGQDKSHGKFVFDRGRLTAIGWGMADVMEEFFRKNGPVDIVFTLEENSFRGASSVRMLIRDFDQAS